MGREQALVLCLVLRGGVGGGIRVFLGGGGGGGGGGWLVLFFIGVEVDELVFRS